MRPNYLAEEKKTLSSSLKTNLVLAGVLAVLAGGAYWYEFHSKPERESEEKSSSKLVSLKDDAELESIVIKDEQKSVDVELQCRENCKFNDPKADWVMVRPLEFDADDPNVGTFITTVFGANAIETLKFESDEKPNLASFGLSDEKRAKNFMQLRVKGHDPYTIYLGDETPVGGNVYAYLGDKIHIVRTTLKINQQRDPSYWRNRKIFRFDAKKVTAFSLKNGASQLELNKKGDEWFFSDGSRVEVDTANAYVTGISFMQAKGFASDSKTKDFAKLGVSSNPAARLTLHFDDKSSLEFQIFRARAKDKGKVKTYGALLDQPHLFEIDEAGSEKFERDRTFFRFRNLFLKGSRPTFAYVSVEFPKGGMLKAEREGSEANKWKLISGAVKDFDSSRFAKALDHVSKLRILEFQGVKAVPSGSRQLSKWKVEDENRKVLSEFVLYEGPKSTSAHYVKIGKEYMKLEMHDAKDLPTAPEQLSASAPATPAPTPAPTMSPDGRMKNEEGPSHDDHHGHAH